MMMLRKISVIFISCLALLLQTGIVAYADYDEPETAVTNVPPSTMTAYLTNDNGTAVPVLGQLSDCQKISNDTYESTYTYDVLRSVIDNDKTSSGTDSTISVRFYLTIGYKYDNSNGKYLLTRVSGSWKFLDDQVRVTNVTVTYGCSDLLGASQSGSKAVSNDFSFNTGFTKYALKDAGGSGLDGVIGAYLNATLKRGASSSWSFKLENYV